MARPLRISFPGAIYHVMARGNSKNIIFTDATDHARFAEVLEESIIRFGLKCHARCQMPNHYHLVVETPAANLSAAMKHLNGVYSQWWNTRHGRCGHLMQGRFKAQLVQRERYLIAVCRYVRLNPVRAKLVSKPEDWPWGSCGAAVGSALATAVYEDIDVGPAIRGDVRFIGDDNFLAEQRAAADGEWQRTHRFARRETRLQRPDVAQIVDAAAPLTIRNQQLRAARAQFGFSISALARHLGLSRSGVRKILKRPAPSVVDSPELFGPSR